MVTRRPARKSFSSFPTHPVQVDSLAMNTCIGVGVVMRTIEPIILLQLSDLGVVCDCAVGAIAGIDLICTSE